MHGIGTIDWPPRELLPRLGASFADIQEPDMSQFLQTAAEILIDTLAALGEAG